jgi:RimJ/RimL family protein N-acetyltransferase
MSESEYITISERLGFRLFANSDFENLKKLDMDPDVRAYFPDGVSTPEQITQRIERNRDSYARIGFSEFAVIDRKTGKFSGRAGFSLMDDGEIEVGYVFLKEYWGRGLAQESLRALLAWGKQTLSVKRILAYAPCEHSASLNVMKRCGMRYLKTATMHNVKCDFYEYLL